MWHVAGGGVKNKGLLTGLGRRTMVDESLCGYAILVSLQFHEQIWDPLSKFVLHSGQIWIALRGNHLNLKAKLPIG